MKTFYTSLYRSLLHPNTFNDADGRYIGFDNTIHTVAKGHTQYANFSDWDTYRASPPCRRCSSRSKPATWPNRWCTDAEQSGSFPRWALANSATGEMTGDSVVPLIVNLYTYGAKDFDIKTALRYMVNGATQGGVGLNGYVERPGIGTYLQLGYAPRREFRGDHRSMAPRSRWSGRSMTSPSPDSPTRWATPRPPPNSRTGRSTGRTCSIRPPVTSRPATPSGFFRDGPGFVQPISGFGQDGFDEGNAEQYLWLVPQNVAGLVDRPRRPPGGGRPARPLHRTQCGPQQAVSVGR